MIRAGRGHTRLKPQHVASGLRTGLISPTSQSIMQHSTAVHPLALGSTDAVMERLGEHTCGACTTCAWT